MVLLNSGFVVTETTFGGTTAGASSGAPGGVGLHISKVVAFGQSSVASNSSGGLKLRYGTIAGTVETTRVLLPVPSSNTVVITLDDLRIDCNWFDLATEEAGAFGAFVFGK